MSKSLMKPMINPPGELMSFLDLKFSPFWKTTSHILVLCLSGFTIRCVGNFSKQICSVVYVIFSKCKMQFICFDSIWFVVMILQIYSVCWCDIYTSRLVCDWRWPTIPMVACLLTKTNKLAEKLKKNFFIYHPWPLDRWINESYYSVKYIVIYSAFHNKANFIT